MKGLACVRLHKGWTLTLFVVRLPKKHIHDQKHCYWFRKLCFSHWILVYPQPEPGKLWEGHLLSDEIRVLLDVQSSAVPLSHSCLLLPHTITGSLLTPSSFLQTFALKLLWHLSLCTIFFPEKSSLVYGKARVYTQPAGPDNFIFKYSCSLLLSLVFFSFGFPSGIFPNNDVTDYLPCF